MSPSGRPGHDDPEGELTAPPPSDLSDYTWDDADRQSRHPAIVGGDGELDDGNSLRSRADEFRALVQGLIASRLIDEAELRALCSKLFPDGTSGDADRLTNELIRRGTLTRYQSAAFLQGKTRGLFIGDYVVREKVGSGGMGIVFKARHRRTRRDVALKLLPPSFSRDHAAVSRFRREAVAVAKLRHPNIVQAIGSGETNGLLYLVMELVDGRDLSRTVKEQGPLTTAQALDCVIQAALGLEEAHRHGIIHRDIKPANLLLDRVGTVKVLDLGLARVNEIREFSEVESSDGELTVSGSVIGTVDYMAPEQAYDPRLADGRSDIYSLGCTLHYLLTGKAPYGGKTFMQRLLGHRERPIPSLRDSRADVSPAIDAVYRGMLAKSPEGRPQTMGQAVRELQSCLDTPARKKSRRPTMGKTSDPDEDEPGSVYEFAEAAEVDQAPRAEAAGSVFVPSRGSSDNRFISPGLPTRRRRRRWLIRIAILAAMTLAAWRFLGR